MQACWARDGEHLAVLRFLAGWARQLVYVALDGSSAEELISPRQSVTGMFPCAFSPDGRRLLFARLEGQHSQMFLLDMPSRTGATAHALAFTQLSCRLFARWPLARVFGEYQLQRWTASLRFRAPAGQEERLTSTSERIRHLSYSPDGAWLYVQPSHRNIYRLPAHGGPLQPVTHFPESGLFLEEPMLSPDGRYFVYNRGHGGSSLWMLTIASDDSAR